MISKEYALTSVLVIEDNEDTRNHLVEILQLYFHEVTYAVDGYDGLKKIEKLTPDIIISDIKMPCVSGIELIKQVRSDSYNPVVILSTAFSDKEYLLEALDMKVDAYLIKPIDVDTLIKKIKVSLKNSTKSDRRYKKLSMREFEVFLDLSKGLKPLEIALKYKVKAKTISTYRARIFEKMFFKTNAELVAYAIKNNLL